MGRSGRIHEAETGPLPKAGARVSSPAARRDGAGRWAAQPPGVILGAAGEDTRAPGPFVNPPCPALPHSTMRGVTKMTNSFLDLPLRVP